jgi:hypothetical protein
MAGQLFSFTFIPCHESNAIYREPSLPENKKKPYDGCIWEYAAFLAAKPVGAVSEK